jgi:transcriptional regulator with XRE-family HTH domain
MEREKDKDKMTVGSFLRKQRQAAGLTQGQLAGRIGLDQSNYSKIELGKHCPDASVIFRIADALGAQVIFGQKNHE